MKRMVCVLMVVSIACAGCEDTGSPKIKSVETIVGLPHGLERLSKLKEENEKLQEELYEARNMPKKDKASLARIAKIEDAIIAQREKSRAEIKRLKEELVKAEKMPKQYKALLVKLAELETALGYQMEVERAEKALMLRIDEHEATINSAMVALTTDLLVRIDELEDAIESKREVERVEKDLLVRMAELEAEIESQRAEIESSENVYRLYEVAIESQKVTIESLEKLCRMYEAEIESQGKSRSSEESPLGKEPEAGQHQGHE